MPTFTSGNGAFTPNTSNDNWNLDVNTATAGTFGKVVAIGWGGQLTTSTGYRTRWTRPQTAASSTFTALSLQAHQPNYQNAGARVGTWAVQAALFTDPNSNLWAQSWNGQGGVGMIVFPLANPWWFVTGAMQGQISCRNVSGTDASGSSYEVTWEE